MDWLEGEFLLWLTLKIQGNCTCLWWCAWNIEITLFWGSWHAFNVEAQPIHWPFNPRMDGAHLGLIPYCLASFCAYSFVATKYLFLIYFLCRLSICWQESWGSIQKFLFGMAEVHCCDVSNLHGFVSGRYPFCNNIELMGKCELFFLREVLHWFIEYSGDEDDNSLYVTLSPEPWVWFSILWKIEAPVHFAPFRSESTLWTSCMGGMHLWLRLILSVC